jgi:hypothetical protein
MINGTEYKTMMLADYEDETNVAFNQLPNYLKLKDLLSELQQKHKQQISNKLDALTDSLSVIERKIGRI